MRRVTSRSGFMLGMRVRPSIKGYNLVPKKYRDGEGTVVGFGHDSNTVRVQWDGTKSTNVTTYHILFVEKIPEDRRS